MSATPAPTGQEMQSSPAERGNNVSFWKKYKYIILWCIVTVVLVVIIAVLIIYFLNAEETPEEKGEEGVKEEGGGETRKVKPDTKSTKTKSTAIIDGLATEEELNNEASYQVWCLSEHNKLREKHEAQPLKLNKKMTRQSFQCANYYIEHKKIDHSCPHRFIEGKTEKYGENLYMAKKIPGTQLNLTVRAMNGWYREWQDYDFERGTRKDPKKQTGHFTQMVWTEAFELGVGLKKQGDWVVVVCLYNPHGNIKDEYTTYVKRQKS